MDIKSKKVWINDLSLKNVCINNLLNFVILLLKNTWDNCDFDNKNKNQRFSC